MSRRLAPRLQPLYRATLLVPARRYSAGLRLHVVDPRFHSGLVVARGCRSRTAPMGANGLGETSFQSKDSSLPTMPSGSATTTESTSRRCHNRRPVCGTVNLT